MEKFYNELRNKGVQSFGKTVKFRNGLFSEDDLVSLGGVDALFQIDKEGLYEITNTILQKQSSISKDNDFSYMKDLFLLVQDELNKYFGTGSEANRERFYVLNGREIDDERICSLSQLKGKGVAKCAEKASVANNILLILNQMGLFNYEVHYLNSLASFNSSFPEGHAFLEFSRVNSKGEKVHIIYDVTNPEIIRSNNNGDNNYYNYPALYLLMEEEFIDFMNGKPFDNSHFIFKDYELKEKREYIGYSVKKEYENSEKETLTTLQEEKDQLKKIRDEYIEMSKTPVDYNFESSRDGTMSEYITPLENRSNGIKR